MITAKITIADKNIKAILGEDLQSNQRANITIKQNGKDALISINAKDAVAFRAVMNTLTNLLSVKEKTENDN